MQTIKEELKNKLIDAAIAEFSLHGYEKASMRNIARAAGTSVSNTYNYFENKEQLFISIVEPVYRKIKDVVLEASEASGAVLQNDDISGFTKGIVNRLLELSERDRLLLVILVEKSQGTRYEAVKGEISTLMKAHISALIPAPEYITGIISENYIQGVFTILKGSHDPEEIRNYMEILFTYHLNGIKALM